MTQNELCRPEDFNQEQMAEYILDLLHRILVHHTLWFREVEHQLGFAKAMQAERAVLPL